jgi:molybdopterin-containing oxidoreductase family iron-sulfur binding subunit
MKSPTPISIVPAAPRYWRSLAEAAQTKEFLASLGPEFPSPAPPWADAVSRRNFLKLMGASVALSGLEACTREPIRPIVPYVKQPEELIPGKPLHYATAMPFAGFASGLLVESHEGHPTKIEGNPTHPASLGATGIFQQAALLDLYDPDRSQVPTNAGQISTFPLFQVALDQALGEQQARRGAGLRILTQSLTSPTLVAQLEELLVQFPEARWHQYQPLSRDNSLEGARQIFGQAVETRCRLDRARVILSLDADFLFGHPANLVYTRQFAEGRRPTAEMNRLYAVETTPSLTGSVADHRLALSPADIQEIAFALARKIGLPVAATDRPMPERHRQWVLAVAQDLRENPGKCLVMAGEPQPPAVHALVHLLNDRLGNAGHTLEYASSAETHWINQRESLAQLVKEMNAGAVECLIILGGNPVFDAPADLPFRHGLGRVKFSVHLGPEQNETSSDCHWHIPESHFLESWSDARSFDGATTIIQPLIAPLYDSKTAHELLHVISRRETRSDYDIVRDYWHAQPMGEDFEKSWRQALHDGWIAGSQLPPLSIQPRPGVLPLAESARPKNQGEQLEICFRPDPTIWDGRFANNGWLQELPKPFSKITWDNPALISPALAQRLQLASGDLVELRGHGRTVTLPVWITPGQAENSVTVHLGLGRTHVGRVGKGAGFNGYILRDSQAAWFASGLDLVKTGKNHPLATTQQSHNTEGRDIIRSSTLAKFLSDAAVTQKNHEPPPARDDTLYNPGEFKNPDYAWGMAIDLNACIGCNACVLACQAENNIPVVGKEQVAAGRDMAWIRIDQYFEGGSANPRIHHQPVPCMHCENAPCELVCPVGATLHDHEGLNLQVYNRCVGTRYCSNNCPYKVRRFNFFRYADYETPSLKAMRNPNVTVRWRGVMEKCTYCIQRISAARIAAQLEDRPIRDGEIKTACQQVCPAQAITFGNIHDPASAVIKLKSSPLNYAMLGELNTRPRTTYLARLRNPNPQLEEAS